MNLKEIPLTQGKTAIVDADRYDELIQFKWCADKRVHNWYARAVGKDGKMILMHRYLMGFPPERVDHIDRKGLHNWVANLRVADKFQNAQNRTPRGNKSGFLGVYKCGDYWTAELEAGGERFRIGYFKHKEDAAFYRDLAAIRRHGVFAVLNFPGLRKNLTNSTELIALLNALNLDYMKS